MEEDISKWIKPLNYRDLVIVSILCITTIGVALYDFYNQMETKQVCLNDCNNHWVKEFETKCMGIYGQKNMSQSLVYSLPIPNIDNN